MRDVQDVLGCQSQQSHLLTIRERVKECQSSSRGEEASKRRRGFLFPAALMMIAPHRIPGILMGAFLFVAFTSFSVQADSDYFLYDISTDPHESNNLYYDDSYSDVVDSLTKRMEYWTDQVKDPEVPDWTDADKKFKDIGGTGAWLTVDYEPITVTQLYDYKDAPHIVFILVDDWGWNDIGWRSTYLSWTTPTIDRLAQEGVRLNNHYSHEICVPTRGALMTGRYSLRLGLWDQTNQQSSVLPLNETTIAQELKSAGYKTYMVGKWDLGYAATQYYPTSRGFGDYYGFYTSAIDYWTKNAFTSNSILGDDADGTYLDLHTGDELVQDKLELSSDYHSAALLEEKAEAALKDWSDNYSDQPFFLYYSLQLIHGPYEAPERFLKRCGNVDSFDDYEDSTLTAHCALNVMLDEVIANLTCTLESIGAYDNTILILTSDNGGQEDGAVGLSGNNYPQRGSKGSYWRGGVSTTAFIHSKLLPTEAWGSEYNGNVHITDWLPTIMGLATNNAWSGPLSGLPIDGVNMWYPITSNNTDLEREEMVFWVDDDTAVIQYKNYRFYYGVAQQTVSDPVYVFSEDKDSSLSYEKCSDPSLMYYTDTYAALRGTVASFANKLGITKALHTVSEGAVAGYLAVLSVLAVALVTYRYKNRQTSSSSAGYSSIPGV